MTAPRITIPPNPAHGPWRRFNAQAVEADIRIGNPIGDDLIFEDGFESNGLGEWSFSGRDVYGVPRGAPARALLIPV